MPGENIQDWSVTAANNGNSDTSIIWSEGQSRASVNNSSRSEMAAIAKDRNLKNGSIVTGGSANAQTFTSGVGYSVTIPNKLTVRLKIGAGLTNTATATLNMDGIGDTLIKTDNGQELRGGELVAGCFTDFLYDGTNWIFLYSREFFQAQINGGGGVIIGTQIFSTPGTFTYIPTAGAEAFIIECIGGGGGGGGSQSPAGGQWYSGGGGGGGGYSRKIATAADIGASQVITIDAGGAGTTGTGNSGGTTSVGSLCGANGGGGGGLGSHGAGPSIGGLGATVGTGDIATAGNAGESGIFSQNWSTGKAGGSGGAGPFGGGGLGSGFNPSTPSNASGGAAGAYGGGGGGASSADGTNRAGGNGSGGIVIITEFAGRGAPGQDGPEGPIGPMGPSGAGTGDVLRFGTPTVGQIARWVSASQIEGASNLGIFTTGDAKLTFKTTADNGWVMADDGSIGSATSGATTRANADTSDLFTLLYTNITALVVQDSAGATVARGASAAADFGNARRLVLPKSLGRALAVAGSGASLTPRALGSVLGEETHVQTIPELAAHIHTSSPGLYVLTDQTTGTPGTGGPYYLTNFAVTGTASTGSSSPMNVMQPTTFLNVMIKL